MGGAGSWNCNPHGTPRVPALCRWTTVVGMSSRRNQTLVGVIVVLLSSGARAMAQPLNVILIMSDDVGVEAFSCYGGESYETPRIDLLYSAGLIGVFAHPRISVERS